MCTYKWYGSEKPVIPFKWKFPHGRISLPNGKERNNAIVDEINYREE